MKYYDYLAVWEILKSADGELYVNYEAKSGMPIFPKKSGLISYKEMLGFTDEFLKLQHEWIAPQDVVVVDLTIKELYWHNQIKFKIHQIVAGKFINNLKDKSYRIYGSKFKKGKRYLFVGAPNGGRLDEDRLNKTSL